MKCLLITKDILSKYMIVHAMAKYILFKGGTYVSLGFLDKMGSAKNSNGKKWILLLTYQKMHLSVAILLQQVVLVVNATECM